MVIVFKALKIRRLAMDTKTLDRLAKANETLGAGATLFERWYYVALRGLYAQYRMGEISREQAEHDKEVIVDAFLDCTEDSRKKIVHLNKKQVVKAVVHELGRYISCATTNAEREKAYPRMLFEERIVKVIDNAYGDK